MEIRGETNGDLKISHPLFKRPLEYDFIMKLFPLITIVACVAIPNQNQTNRDQANVKKPTGVSARNQPPLPLSTNPNPSSATMPQPKQNSPASVSSDASEQDTLEWEKLMEMSDDEFWRLSDSDSDQSVPENSKQVDILDNGPLVSFDSTESSGSTATKPPLYPNPNNSTFDQYPTDFHLDQVTEQLPEQLSIGPETKIPAASSKVHKKKVNFKPKTSTRKTAVGTTLGNPTSTQPLTSAPASGLRKNPPFPLPGRPKPKPKPAKATATANVAVTL